MYISAGKDQLITAPLDEGHVDVSAEISLVAIHFFLHMLLVVFSAPENIISEGVYQAVGPCDETEQIFSRFGLV